MKNKTCVFQMMRQKDGTRSDPFTMTIGKLATHLKRLPLEEIKDDFVLVLMELGEIEPDASDYGSIAKNGVFSVAPIMNVETYLTHYGDE